MEGVLTHTGMLIRTQLNVEYALTFGNPERSCKMNYRRNAQQQPDGDSRRVLNKHKRKRRSDTVNQSVFQADTGDLRTVIVSTGSCASRHHRRCSGFTQTLSSLGSGCSSPLATFGSLRLQAKCGEGLTHAGSQGCLATLNPTESAEGLTGFVLAGRQELAGRARLFENQPEEFNVVAQ